MKNSQRCRSGSVCGLWFGSMVKAQPNVESWIWGSPKVYPFSVRKVAPLGDPVELTVPRI